MQETVFELTPLTNLSPKGETADRGDELGGVLHPESQFRRLVSHDQMRLARPGQAR